MKYVKGNIVYALDEKRKYQDYHFEERASFKQGIVISVMNNISLYDANSPGRSYQVQQCQLLMSSGNIRTFYSNELEYFSRVIEKRKACKAVK